MKVPRFALALFTSTYLSSSRTENFAPIYRPTPYETIALNQSFVFLWGNPGNYTGNLTAILYTDPSGMTDIDDMTYMGSEMSVPIMQQTIRVDLPDYVPLPESASYRLKMVWEEDDTVFNYSPPFFFTNSSTWE